MLNCHTVKSLTSYGYVNKKQYKTKPMENLLNYNVLIIIFYSNININ